MTTKPIDPKKVAELQAQGALLADIREPDEFARRHIPGAVNLPLSRLGAERLPASARHVVYLCRSGNRTSANARRLPCPPGGDAYILEGGLDAWVRTGLSVSEDRSQPLEIMRQVQIAAGLLILVGIVLGLTADPAFLALSAFVGAGLTFAGLSGWCGMAKLLAVMPWNRPAAG